MSHTNQFILNDIEFYEHCEQTVECRSGIWTYMINKKCVKYEEYWRAIISALRDMNALTAVSRAVGHNTYT